MTTEVETTTMETDLTYEQLREAAKNSYNKMKKSWFSFARAIAVIHETEAWKDYGYDSFKEFVMNEYRDMNYMTIVKFIKIVEAYGKEIEARLKKDPDADIAAYESFYALSSAAKNLSKTDVTRLKKQLVDANVTYKKIREEINSKIKDTVKEIKEKKEEEVTVFDSVAEATVPLSAVPDLKDTPTEKDVEEAEDIPGLVALSTTALKTLTAGLDAITKAGEIDLDNTLIELGNDLEGLKDNINSFLKIF